MEKNESRSNKIATLYQKDMINAMKDFLVAVKNEDPIEMAKAFTNAVSINKIMVQQMALFSDISVADEFETDSKTK